MRSEEVPMRDVILSALYVAGGRLSKLRLELMIYVFCHHVDHEKYPWCKEAIERWPR